MAAIVVSFFSKDTTIDKKQRRSYEIIIHACNKGQMRMTRVVTEEM